MALAAGMGVWSCPLAEPEPSPAWPGEFIAGKAALRQGQGEDVGLWWSCCSRATLGNETSPRAGAELLRNPQEGTFPGVRGSLELWHTLSLGPEGFGVCSQVGDDVLGSHWAELGELLAAIA